MRTIYIAVRKTRDTDYEIEVPDLPGCKTTAIICGDIQSKAKQVIQEHILRLCEAGGYFLHISQFRDLVDLPEYHDVVWHAVFDVDPYTLTLDENLL